MREQRTENREQRKKKGLVFVISGPSGSGKTSLAAALLKDSCLKRKLTRAISYTTRHRRSGERSGRDYCFISEQEFVRARREKKVLEWTKYLGYYYATSKEFIRQKLSEGKTIVLCLDLKGACALKRLYPRQARTIFIMPPSLDVLRTRIRNRCSKTKKEEIHRRLVLARRELCAYGDFDYCLVNKDFEQTAEELKTIILGELDARS